MKYKTIRTEFVKQFSENLADKLESAANEHQNGINSSNKGSDRFKWVLLLCIGYQCFEKDSYREHHGIKGEAGYEEIKQWIKDYADLASHDGDCDFLSLITGVYNEYTGNEEVAYIDTHQPPFVD